MLPGRSGHRTSYDTRSYCASQASGLVGLTTCQKICYIAIADFDCFELFCSGKLFGVEGFHDRLHVNVHLAERQGGAWVLESVRQRCGCGYVAGINCAFELGKRFVFREFAQFAVVDDVVVAVVERAGGTEPGAHVAAVAAGFAPSGPYASFAELRLVTVMHPDGHAFLLRLQMVLRLRTTRHRCASTCR